MSKVPGNFETRGLPWKEIAKPEDWEIASLGDLLTSLRSGFACGRNDQVADGLAHLRPMNISPDGRIDLSDCRFVPPDAGEQRLRRGDILFNNTNSPPWVGKTAWIGAEHEGLAFSNHMTQLRVSDAVSSKFFALQLDWLRRAGYFYVNCNKHVNQASISGDFLREKAPMLVPPEPEQKRIAGKLEAVLGRVDVCRARLARVPDLLKRFRQSVLSAATSGRLTADWRETQRITNEWEHVELGSLMESKPRNGYSPRSVEYDTPTKSLTLTATTSGRFQGEHSKFIDETIPPSSHLWLRPGDILVQRANTIEYVGVSAIFDGPLNKFIYPDLMMKCRANERTTTGFLHILLQSEGVRQYFRDNATGTAGNMPKINQGTVMTAPARLPTILEQQEIVRRVEALFTFSDRIDARLKEAQTTVDRLTPSILAKAFRGELVPQNPNDEPASNLLERIRINRTSLVARRPRKMRLTSTAPRAPKENAIMTKSRFDEDVKDKPYLATILRDAEAPLDAENLFRRSELPLVDFYKQLGREVEQGFIKNNREKLEAVA